MGHTQFSSSDIPKGILLIVALFLILGGAQIKSGIYSVFTLFPMELDATVLITQEGASPLRTLLNVFSGCFCLLVAYGLYTRTPWSRPLTFVLSTLSVAYGLTFAGVSLFGMYIWLASSPQAGIMASAMVLTITMVTYNLIIVILMIYVILYLRWPEIKEWFIEKQKNESVPIV